LDSFNRWLDRFCYRHPRFGIKNLMKYIVVLNIAVYILFMVDTRMVFIKYLYFNPLSILRGQFWRLLTYVFVPVEANVLFFAIMQYFYYFIGTRLEAEWGSGRFTFYYVFSVLVSALIGVFLYLLTGSQYLDLLSANYINLSLFFAFATMYPEARVLLFFFIPVKIKWLAVITAAYYLFSVARYFAMFPYNLMPIAALIAYFLFFGNTLIRLIRETVGTLFRRPYNQKVVNFSRIKRSARKKAAGNPGKRKETPYTRKCAVCGRTDAEFPNLDFRYCSKCAGYHCFCEEHINSHIHFTE
jgi:membrane associated rhomboid family serine protease